MTMMNNQKQYVTDEELPKLGQRYVHVEGFKPGAVYILVAYSVIGSGPKYLLRTPKSGRLISTSNRLYHTKRNTHE